MDNNDFIREIKSLFDRFIAEFITINSEYEQSIGKDLEEMKKEIQEDKEWAEFSTKQFEEIQKRNEKEEIDEKLNGVVG